MTPEQLMQPRFKVVADYPNNPHSIGTIINGSLAPKGEKDWKEKYPAIYQKLEWWQDIDWDNDRPKYVKFLMDYIDFKKGDVFATIPDWHKPKKEHAHMCHMAKDIESSESIDNYFSVPFSHYTNVFSPATEEEYKKQNKNKSKLTSPIKAI